MEITGTPAEIYEQHVLPATIARWTPDLVKVLGVRPGERVLDVACGTGVVTRLLPDRVGPTGRVVGLDVNVGMLAVARAVAAQAPIEWVEGNAMGMPTARCRVRCCGVSAGLAVCPGQAGRAPRDAAGAGSRRSSRALGLALRGACPWLPRPRRGPRSPYRGREGRLTPLQSGRWAGDPFIRDARRFSGGVGPCRRQAQSVSISRALRPVCSRLWPDDGRSPRRAGA